VPDLIALGKSIGAGFPLSAVVGNKKYFDSLPKGSIGTTLEEILLHVLQVFEVIKMIEKENFTFTIS